MNGRLVSARNATVSVDDWGLRYGWGAFDTLRVHQKRPLFLRRHLDRLYAAAQALHLPPSVSVDQWRRDVYRTMRRAQLSEGVINLYWTVGTPPAVGGQRIITARRTNLPIGRPAKLWVAPWRIEPTTPGIGIKTMAYFPNIFASVCARSEGFDAALLVNAGGHLADGATTSLFIVDGEHIITPALSEGALPGITRALVLEAAGALGIRADEGRVPWRRVWNADALLLTSAIRGIAVVKAIGDRQMRSAAHSAGAATIARLRRRYRQMIADEIAATSPAF